jgi:hypothetical protein
MTVQERADRKRVLNERNTLRLQRMALRLASGAATWGDMEFDDVVGGCRTRTEATLVAKMAGKACDAVGLRVTATSKGRVARVEVTG